MAWKYMNHKLDPNELPTMKALLSEINENGGTDAALAGLREKQYRQYCCELIWRYPISHGDSTGGFIMPVREGILWIPYDEMDKEAGEILRTSDAVLMDEAACAAYAEDFRSYADGLCSALRQNSYICRVVGRGNRSESIIDLGSFEMVSGRMAVSDPCFDTGVWCRGELEDVLPGIWEASVVKRESGVGTLENTNIQGGWKYAELGEAGATHGNSGRTDRGTEGISDRSTERSDQ